jgi:hypothetical protein
MKRIMADFAPSASTDVQEDVGDSRNRSVFVGISGAPASSASPDGSRT